MNCTTEIFGKTADGTEDVTLYRITGGGITADILSYGGIICRLLVPDKNGVVADVVLGQDTMEGYGGRGASAGAFIGRVANRISGAEFAIDGRTYPLQANFGTDLIHGGAGNYARRNFCGQTFNDGFKAGVTLSLTDNGEGGFPGKVDVTLTYSLDESGNFGLKYTALPEMDTPINFTNHVYFNIAGQETGNVGEHILQLNADFITPNDGRGMTTGEILAVKGTDFDFTEPKPIKTGLESSNPLFTQFGGFDMNYCIRGRGFRKGGSVTDPKSGRCMEFYTDLPGVQVFSMPRVPEGATGKKGAPYVGNGAICFETQLFPDCTNYSQFPSPFVKAGTKYETETIYRFI